MKSPLFTIIIPLYNKEKSIFKTINSVIFQTYTDFEVIIVDDGSQDNSYNIANSFSDNRISCYKKTNGGVASARNYGITKSKGEWLLFLDADDLLKPNALEIFVELQLQIPGYDFYLGNMELYNSLRCRNEALSSISTNTYKDWWKMVLAPETGTFVVKRNKVLELGGYDERISCFEDLAFAVKYMDVMPFVYTSKVIKIYQKEYSELSVNKQPISKEYAYYITKQDLLGSSLWKKLVLAYNVWDTCQHRIKFGDLNGERYYRDKISEVFPFYIRSYLFFMESKRKAGKYKKGLFRLLFR